MMLWFVVNVPILRCDLFFFNFLKAAENKSSQLERENVRALGGHLLVKENVQI